MSATALATPLSPFFRQFQPTSWLMENACMKQKCPFTSHVKWTVRCWQEAAWKFSSWLHRCDDCVMMAKPKSQRAPTPNPFPEIPLSDYGGTPTWTLSNITPFYRWGKWWLAKFYSKNDALGQQGQRIWLQKNQSQILCLVMIVLSGFYCNLFSF